MKKAEAGFNILEVLVIILVVGILFSIGFYNYNNYLKRVRLQEATSQVISDLEKIRSNSIKSSKDGSFIITASDKNKYAVTIQGKTTNKQLPYNAVMSVSDASNVITYLAPYGEVEAGTADRTLSITIPNNGKKDIHLVGVTGMVIR